MKCKQAMKCVLKLFEETWRQLKVCQAETADEQHIIQLITTSVWKLSLISQRQVRWNPKKKKIASICWTHPRSGCSSGGSTGQLRLVIQSLAALVCMSGILGKILTPMHSLEYECLTESSAGEWGMHNSIISEPLHTGPWCLCTNPNLVLPHTLIIFKCNSLFLHPVQRGAAGSTGPASVSWHATSDGDVVGWSAAYPAD